MSLLRTLNVRIAPAVFHGARRTASNVPAPSFTAVKFVKEDVAKVMEEIPEFNFYEMKDPTPNKYKGVAMDTCVLDDVPAPQLVAPQVKHSKLENGLKVASIDNSGLTASVGLYVSAGSRFETPASFGAAHMVELMAFKSTAHLSNLRTLKTFEQLGASISCTAGRETLSYKVDVLREYLPLVVPLLVGNVLFPRLLPWEVKAASQAVGKSKAALETDTDAYIAELLLSTAFLNNTVGQKPVVSPQAVGTFTADTIRDYMLDHFAPERMAIVGVNVDHDELSKWAMRSFAEYNAIPMKARPDTKPSYTGGDCRIDTDGGCSIAIGFEGAAISSADRGPLMVLESLLDAGGSSLLGKAGLAASASATFYSDTGIFAVTGSCEPAKASAYCSTLATVLKGLGSAKGDDVTKAKTYAKNLIALQAQEKGNMVDSMGMSLLSTGMASTVADLQKLVDGVSDSQLTAVAKKLLASKPTVVAHGDIYNVPHYSAIEASLK